MKVDKKQSIFKGKKLTIEIFGASHDSEIGTRVQGFNGEKIDREKLQK